MTAFDSIKNKNIDELAEWLDKYGQYDGSPWNEWFNKNYCQKCESEMGRIRIFEIDRDIEFAWCEIHNKCRFFPQKNEILNAKEIIKMWLESEDKEHYEERV